MAEFFLSQFFTVINGLTPDSSVQAHDRSSGLRAFAEVLLVPGGRDVWLGTAGTLEAAKITSLSDE